MAPFIVVKMRETKYLRVGIADGHPLIRKVIGHVVQDAGFKVIADAANVSELIDNLKKTGVPDIFIIIIKLTGGNCLESCFTLKQQYPGCKMLAVSITAYPYNENMLHRFGIDMYVNDISHPNQLINILHELTGQ